MYKNRELVALCLAVVFCLLMLAGCAEEAPVETGISVCVGGEPASLDPIYAESSADQTILAHLYENLMRISVDENGNAVVENGMAKNVEHEENHDGTVTFTFQLRDAKWSDGQRVSASDFVYAWQRLVNPASQSPFAELLSVVVGYAEARVAGDMSLLQIVAKNESTLEVTLTGHYDWFLREVCTSPATMPLRQDVLMTLKESAVEKGQEKAWWGDPVQLVTNGPFGVEVFDSTGMELTGNESYYNKVSGPSQIRFHFANTEEDMWSLYEEGLVDAVSAVSKERLDELAGNQEWMPVPELATHAVLFNSNHAVLSDIRIRQAMSMVVDRNALVELIGGTARVAEGLVPFGVPENEEGDFRTVGGPLLKNDPEMYAEACLQAQEMIGEAGYNSGVELGQIEYLYVAEGMADEVVAALCQQWKETLRIEVIPKAVSEAELWTALRSGTYAIAGTELDAAGNDAECFLMQWTSDSSDNVVGYTNSAYDTLMAIIASAADGAARMGCLHDAEALLLSDYSIIPVYTHGVAWELRETHTGALRDARGWFSFVNVREKPV